MTDASASAPEPPFTTDTWVVAASDQVSAALEGETIVLTMRGGVYYALDRVGSRVWALIAMPTPLAVVHATLVREYDVAPGTAWNDLVTLVADLFSAGLLIRAVPAR